MLAVGLEWDVLEQHDLVIAANFLEGSAEMDRRILGISLGIFEPRPRNPFRCIEQAFAIGIVACPAN